MVSSSPRRTIADLPVDFWVFWAGQAISTLGSSFTGFAVPLLIFKLTGSAVNLSLSIAISYLPSVVLGLLVGAWVDRMNRKRLMIAVNLILTVTVASIPLAAFTGHLAIGLIYAVQLVNATVRLFFASASFAAIPSLVPKDRLVVANGRIQASYSGLSVAGPLLAGVLAAFVPLSSLLIVDAGSYVLAAASLFLVRGSFNAVTPPEGPSRLRADIMEGLRFLFGHPVLRAISIMMALVNFFSMTVSAQLVYFAKVQLHASNAQVGLLFSANAIGVFALSLLAGPLRRHWPFSRVALGLLEIQGFVTILMAQVHSFWLILPLAALWNGLGILFSINTASLRQTVTPNALLGRVVMTAGVMGSLVIPAGSLLGGVAIARTGSVSLVYSVIGAAVFLIPLIFSFTALGHAERYLPVSEVKPRRAGPHGRDLGDWVEEAVDAVPAQHEGQFATGDLSEEDVAALRQDLEGIYHSAEDVTLILEEVKTTRPGPIALESALTRLATQMDDLTEHWDDLRRRTQADSDDRSRAPGAGRTR